MDIEYSSEQESQSDQEEQFIYHKPTVLQSKKSNENEEERNIYQMMRLCEKIKNQILQNKLIQTAKQICKTIISSQKEQLIVPLLFKRNQQSDLKLLIQIIMEKLKQLQYSELQFFKNKCNKFHIRKLCVDNIKTLALKIYMTDHAIRTKQDIVVYFPEQICDLTPKNIYLLQDGLQSCCYKVIIPTYSDFLNYPYSPQNKMELIPHSLYNPKQLFCQFMYRCIIDQKIKAYLPQQSFNLVTDFDQYPLSYHEGCRRLIFCIIKYRLLLQQRDLVRKIEFVPIGSLFTKIQHAINKIFKVFKDFKKQKMMEKNIKCILHQRDVYAIFQQYLNKIQWFSTQVLKDQIDVICDVRKVIIKKFSDDENFIKFVPILENIQPEGKSVKRLKKRRQDLFNIDPNMNKSEKDILEDQLTKIIKINTSKIRNQAKLISWNQIDFQNKIRPELPLHIFKTVFQTSNKRKILNQITSYSGVSLVRLIHKFCDQEENFGEFMYNMKDLQLYGLIDIIKSSISPTVTPYFFPKSSFTRTNQENDY